MKPITTSFLFFLFLFINYQSLFGQNRLDSLNYFSKKALHPQNFNDLTDAYKYFNNAYLKSLSNMHTETTINYLYYKASIEYKKGDYNKCEESIVNAISLLDKLSNSSYKTQTRNSFNILMGLVYIEQRNAKKAIEFYSKALEKSENSLDSTKIYNNISLIYAKFNDHANSKKELEKAHEILPRITDTLTIAKIMDNLGVAEYKLDKTNGLDLINRALDLRISVNDTSTIYTSYSHISEYYYNTDNLEKSKEYAIKALELANILKSPSYINDALGLLTNLSEDKYAKAYKKINDSLFNAEKEANNQFALMKYDYSEFEKKALKSQLEKEKQESRTIIWSSVASFITLLSIFLYYILKSKHRKEKLQQVYDTESRISKKVHDDIANDVFQVMTTLQADNNLNQNIKGEIELIYDKARDISKQLGEIDLEGDYKEILNDLALRYNTEQTNVILKNVSKIAWEKISKTKKTALYKVLQELMINMKKHSKASIVVITFFSKSKNVIVNYSDDGIGCDLKKSNGLLNVENRIKAIGGTITFESRINNGFKAKIQM